MPTTNTRTKKRVTTTDITGPLTITDKVVISMIQQLAKSYRKDPQTYLQDLVKHHFLYL